MMLALLDEKDLPAPRLECIITSDEEIGMLGAAVLQPTLVTGRNMINLDSEAEGVFTAAVPAVTAPTAVCPSSGRP